ncbi:MAG: hypothetical protein R3F48_00980 [Candidatus Zixiibacteriota bacterium]
MELALNLIGLFGLLGGIVFLIMGMHYRAHDKKSPEYDTLTTKEDMVSSKILTPSGAKAGWNIRGFRYHLIAMFCFILAGIVSVLKW